MIYNVLAILHQLECVFSNAPLNAHLLYYCKTLVILMKLQNYKKKVGVIPLHKCTDFTSECTLMILGKS